MGELGINPVLLLAQIINFLILFFLLKKFLYKPIIKTLDDRKRKIQDGLNYSEKMKSEYEKLEEIKSKKIYQAEKQAVEIIQKAEGMAKEREAQILAKAKEEARELIADEKIDWEKREKQARKRLQRETAELAVLVARSVIKGLIDEKEQPKLIKEALDNIQKLQVN